MSTYLATVMFEDGECMLAVYNSASDNLLVRSLLPDSSEARRFFAEADRDHSERFDALHLVKYGEANDRRERRLWEDAKRSSEQVIVQIPGYGAAFRSQASRQHRLVTGRIRLPEFQDDPDYLDGDASAATEVAVAPAAGLVRWFRRLFRR